MRKVDACIKSNRIIVLNWYSIRGMELEILWSYIKFLNLLITSLTSSSSRSQQPVKHTSFGGWNFSLSKLHLIIPINLLLEFIKFLPAWSINLKLIIFQKISWSWILNFKFWQQRMGSLLMQPIRIYSKMDRAWFIMGSICFIFHKINYLFMDSRS